MAYDSLFLPLLHPVFQSLVALYSEDGQASILARFGHSEEYRPQHALGCSTDGQQHLCKGQDIERNAAQQHNDSRAKRQRLQPLAHFADDVTAAGLVRIVRRDWVRAAILLHLLFLLFR